MDGDRKEAVREHGLDALRVLAFALLILFHSCLAYVSWPWIIKDRDTIPVLGPPLLALSRWRLPLLFFISGAAARLSLRHRSWGAFARERVTRLLVPLAVGLLVIVPPQIYLERLAGGERLGFAGVLRFLLDHWQDGAQSWHHLWFLLYILAFSLLGLPLLVLLRSGPGQRLAAAAVAACRRWPPALYAMVLPAVAVAVWLAPRWPTTLDLVSDWANLGATLLLFLWGFTVAGRRDALDLLTARRRELAAVALGVAVAYLSAHRAGLARAWAPGDQAAIWGALDAVFAYTWILALVGWARALVLHPYPWLRAANQAVYPLYLFHQTVTVAAVYLLLGWSVSPWLKLALVTAATFGGSWGLYALVRQIPWVRPLFGLRRAAPPVGAPLGGQGGALAVR